MMKKYIALVLAFLLALASCGFHPRGVITGANAGNFNSIIGSKFYIQGNNFSSFANDVRSSLNGYKAQIVTDEKAADYIINIQNVQKRSQMTSVVGGASNNTYQLIYTVTYNVVRPDEKTPVIPNKSLSTQQFWQSNTGTQLAQNSEADRIYTYLQGQLVNNMISQVAALLPSKDNSQQKSSTKTKKESEA
ncbi:hypothetical protein LO80_01045 [Candidatus Francisella endociliophora]|uniref:LPS-assembly lipoprotein LptE n=1 Tax=Candidatus Francisella endociliophora TaxID=653937 RepID=A0A097EMA2_9GAMM|nr:LPS assembly lipoprotein LptE [Francisella sp. FSC1006]AIT08696.1 hypothetical protein LO80_01045 [Francisella sp. FSC1006]